MTVSASRAMVMAVLGLTALVLLAEAYPRPQTTFEQREPVYRRPVYDEETDNRPRYVEPQIERRDGYKKPVNVGRVKIQTYRGPNQGHGYHAFAPWGYYVTQPEDDKPYGYYH